MPGAGGVPGGGETPVPGAAGSAAPGSAGAAGASPVGGLAAISGACAAGLCRHPTVNATAPNRTNASEIHTILAIAITSRGGNNRLA